MLNSACIWPVPKIHKKKPVRDSNAEVDTEDIGIFELKTGKENESSNDNGVRVVNSTAQRNCPEHNIPT
jgi:hypothetical protein